MRLAQAVRSVTPFNPLAPALYYQSPVNKQWGHQPHVGRRMDRQQTQLLLIRAVSLALAFGAFHCFNKPMEPVLPQWDVDLSAPVANRTYTLEEIVQKDTSILQVAPGGTRLMLKSSVTADPTYVGDRIALDPIQTSFGADLGPFSVSMPPIDLNIQIPGFTPGMTTIFPALPPTDIPAVSGELPNVQSAVLQSGIVQLRLINRMDVPVRIETPIQLVNQAGGTIASFDFGGAEIPAHGVRTVQTDLAGKTVLQRVRLETMRISSRGSGSLLVTIPDTMLLATISSSDLVALSSTTTQVPPQHFVATRSIPMNTESLIREVWLNRGTLHLRFVSSIDLRTALRLRLPELLRSSGQTFEQTVNIAPRDSAVLSIDLGRTRLRSLDGGFLRSLVAECVADLYGAGDGGAVTLRSTDFVRVYVTSGSVVADSAIAVLKPTMIAIDERVALKLGEIGKKFKGQIDLPGANMIFTPQTSIAAPMELDLRFEAKDRTGKTVSLQMPVTKGTTGLGTIAFAPGDVGGFLSQISGNLPDSLRVVGTVWLNPDFDTTAPAAIGRNCSFAGNVNLSVPLSMRITDGVFADTLVMGDTTGDGAADHRIDPTQLNDFNSGRMFVEIDNGLPMGVKIKLTLLDRSRRPLLVIPQSEGDSITIVAGILAGGDVQAPARSSRFVEMQNTELRSLNVADFVQVGVAVNTPGSGAVNFNATDRVRVRVWTQLSYRVKP